MKLVTFVIEKKIFFKYYISVNKAFLRLEEFVIDTNTSEGITDSKIDSANHFLVAKTNFNGEKILVGLTELNESSFLGNPQLDRVD